MGRSECLNFLHLFAFRFFLLGAGVCEDEVSVCLSCLGSATSWTEWVILHVPSLSPSPRNVSRKRNFLEMLGNVYLWFRGDVEMFVAPFLCPPQKNQVLTISFYQHLWQVSYSPISWNIKDSIQSLLKNGDPNRKETRISNIQVLFSPEYFSSQLYVQSSGKLCTNCNATTKFWGHSLIMPFPTRVKTLTDFFTAFGCGRSEVGYEVGPGTRSIL